MTSLGDLTQGIGTVALGTAQALQRSLSGHPDLVTLLDPATHNALLQCDAVLSETHSRDSAPTIFPLEDGGSISDHIIVTPIELSIQGVITDTPIGDKASLQVEGVATALTAIVPPLGVAIAGVGYAQYQATQGAASRSRTAWQRLLEIQGGDPSACPPIPPKTFDLVTKLRLYRSMVIKSLSVPRDATVSNAIVFQATMTQMIVVAPQSVNVQVLDAPALAAGKKALGQGALEGEDGDTGESEAVKAYRRGDATSTNIVRQSSDRISTFAGKITGGLG